jgi:3D (Asp-Asp-Asp) domain-containing protein
MKITVPDVFVRILHRQSRLEPGVRVRKDPSLPKGVRRTIVEGSAGRLLSVYRVLVMNGREGRPILSAQKRLKAPRPRILVVGTGPKNATAAQLASRAKAPKGGREMRVEATGYSPEEPGLDHTTATGARAKHGVIAVDPHVIRLGTHVYVPGYGYAVAADTGGAIKGRRIDLCYDTVGEAIRWGRRHITIIILD